MIVCIFLIFFTYSEVFADITQKNIVQKTTTNKTILLNETIIIDGQSHTLIKYIENNQQKKTITPLSTTLKTTTKQKSKIDISLIKPMFVNAYDIDKQISVSIILQNPDSYNLSKKIKQKYQQKITTLETDVKTIFNDARKISTKNTMNTLTTKPLSKTNEILIEKNIQLNKTKKSIILEKNQEFENTKKLMMHEISKTIFKKNDVAQKIVLEKIKVLGGTVTTKNEYFNIIFASVPLNSINELSKLTQIVAIEPVGISKVEMDVSAYAVKADKIWTWGDSGNLFEVGITDTGIDSTHPALSSNYLIGKDFVPDDCDGDDAEDYHGHGTHVAGIVASTNNIYKGIAYSSGIINIKVANCTADYGVYDSAVLSGVVWAIDTVADPAEVISHSVGGTILKARFFDSIVDNYDIAVVKSAGNSGPGSETLSAYTYNGIVVGGMNDQNTITRADDTIYTFSSRGPVTSTSRIKPDLMAPGVNILSTAYNWEGANPDYISKSGTSMATPHVSGAATLLMSAGVYSALDIKSLLINTAEDLGITGPDYDYGWGYIDLDHAYTHKNDVRQGTLDSNTNHLFYKGSVLTNDTATVVWNRHVPYEGATYPSTYYDLSDIELYLYDDSDGTMMDSSVSTDENVEQVISTSNANIIIKVDNGGFATGITSETFSLATEEGISLVAPPTFITTSNIPTNIEPLETFTVDANVTNSGGLKAYDVDVLLSLPAGFVIISGANPQNTATLNPATITTNSWTVQAPATKNTYNLAINTSSISYGELYTKNHQTTNILVEPNTPIIIIITPENITYNTTQVALNVSANNSDVWKYSLNNGANITFTPNTTIIAIEGQNSIIVWANDSSGKSNTTTRYFSVDSTSPKITYSFDSQIEKNITVNMTINITDINEADYKIYLNDSLDSFGTYVSGIPFEIAINTSTNTTLNYTIWANDSLGNINETSTLIQILNPIQKVTIHLPTNTTTNNTTPLLNATFSIIANNTWYNIDGGTNSTHFLDTNNLTLQMPTLSNGAHNITVFANNSFGVLNNTIIYFSIDTLAPKITLLYTSQIEQNTQSNITVTILDENEANYKAYKNSSFVNSGSYTNASNFNISINTSQLTVLNYTIWANDSAGNTNETNAIITIVDNSSPVISNSKIIPRKLKPNTNITIITDIIDSNNIQSVVIEGYNTTNNILFPEKSMIKNGNSWYALFNVSNILPQNYHFNITATDEFGNAKTKTIGNITIDIQNGANNTMTNTSITTTNNNIILNETQTTNTILNITTNQSITDAIIAISYYDTNPTTTPIIPAINKYIEIETSNDIKNAIVWSIIEIYYESGDVPAQYDENNLRIYGYDENTTIWVLYSGIQSGSVNTTNNYVWANTTHFSVYGIFVMPTCSDEIKNQDETGIDCGGVCASCAPANPPDNPSDDSSSFKSGLILDSDTNESTENNIIVQVPNDTIENIIEEITQTSVDLEYKDQANQLIRELQTRINLNDVDATEKLNDALMAFDRGEYKKAYNLALESETLMYDSIDTEPIKKKSNKLFFIIIISIIAIIITLKLLFIKKHHVENNDFVKPTDLKTENNYIGTENSALNNTNNINTENNNLIETFNTLEQTQSLENTQVPNNPQENLNYQNTTNYEQPTNLEPQTPTDTNQVEYSTQKNVEHPKQSNFSDEQFNELERKIALIKKRMSER